MNPQIQIDCQACRAPGAMMKTTVPRFSGIVRAIGVVFVVPSILGMLLAGGSFLIYMFSVNSTDGDATGRAVGNVVGVVFFGAIFLVSMIGGLVGWLLLLSRKVFKCQRCGFVLDRA